VVVTGNGFIVKEQRQVLITFKNKWDDKKYVERFDRLRFITIIIVIHTDWHLSVGSRQWFTFSTMSFQRLGALCQFAIELFSCFRWCVVFEIDSRLLVPALRRRISATRAVQTMQEEANDKAADAASGAKVVLDDAGTGDGYAVMMPLATD
jgi:hypothetical protein